MADASTLTLAFMRSHPAAAARVLEGAAPAGSVDLLSRVPARIGGAVLAEMLSGSAAEVLLAMPEERAFELLAQLDARGVVAILRHVEAGRRARFLAALPTRTALAAKLLLEFIDDAVGSCMNPDVIAMASTVRVDEALHRVCNVPVTTDRIFIVDDSRHLLGWAPLAALLRAPAGARLEALVQPLAARIAAHAPLSGARAHPGWRATSTLPVVDRHGRLLGEITRDALERASSGAQPAQLASPSLAAVLAQGYWQSISGILELLTSMLPASRPIGSPPNER